MTEMQEAQYMLFQKLQKKTKTLDRMIILFTVAAILLVISLVVNALLISGCPELFI